MITRGARIRAARGLLGWSQQDLADAAGLHVNGIRHWEAKHGQEVCFEMAGPATVELITKALHKTGLELWHDPPCVRVNPDVYRLDMKPPLYRRWEK